MCIRASMLGAMGAQLTRCNPRSSLSECIKGECRPQLKHLRLHADSHLTTSLQFDPTPVLPPPRPNP